MMTDTPGGSRTAPPERGSSLPDAETLRKIFAQTRVIAVIGAKDTPGQPVDRVGRYLLSAGFRLVPVHPKRSSVWGLPALPCVDRAEADMVVLFRAPQYCAAHAREILRMAKKPLCVWMQEGIRSPEARALLEAAGILVVEDACVYVEHEALTKARD